MPTKKSIAAYLLLTLSFAVSARAEDPPPYRRFATAMHIQSLISMHGKYSLHAIAASARKRGIDILIPTDHFLERWEYGIPPLTGILRTSVARRCVYTFGADKYLGLIAKVQKDYPSMLIIPGVEASPAYYWTGHLFQANLTLHESQRHLLVMGLTDPGDLKRLPVLSNPSAGTIQWKRFVLPAVLVCAGLALMIRWPAGLLLAALGVLWGINQRPLYRLPPAYEQFTRNGYDAAQNLIDYAESRGAISVWAHPEAPNFAEPKKMYRSVSMQTVPYPEAVFETKRFTGFGYFWEGEKILGPAGGIWDQTLSAYARGERERPLWAFGELDWCQDNGEDFTLGSMQNVIWAREKTVPAVMEAFRRGRFYLFKNNINNGLVLERWEVSDGRSAAVSGEESAWSPASALIVDSRLGDDAEYRQLDGEIIRNGKIWKTFKGNFPLTARYPLPEPAEGQKDYYRLVLRAYGGIVVSNPIFVKPRT